MTPLHIAVCGASAGDLPADLRRKARELGSEIGALGHVLVTGACGGYPKDAAEGLRLGAGVSVGVSPAADWAGHQRVYPDVPRALFDVMIHTGFGEGRDVVLVRSADACIFVGGGAGTVMELTLAIKHTKPIGVLTGSGGVEHCIDAVLALSSEPAPPVIRHADPVSLVRRLISCLPPA